MNRLVGTRRGLRRLPSFTLGVVVSFVRDARRPRVVTTFARVSAPGSAPRSRRV